MGMTWNTTRVKNKLFYKIERTFVNVNTGEEVLASLEYIKNNFKVINKTKKVTYSGYTQLEQYRDWETDRKSTRLNSSHSAKSRMPSSA